MSTDKPHDMPIADQINALFSDLKVSKDEMIRIKKALEKMETDADLNPQERQSIKQLIQESEEALKLFETLGIRWEHVKRR